MTNPSNRVMLEAFNLMLDMYLESGRVGDVKIAKRTGRVSKDESSANRLKQVEQRIDEIEAMGPNQIERLVREQNIEKLDAANAAKTATELKLDACRQDLQLLKDLRWVACRMRDDVSSCSPAIRDFPRDLRHNVECQVEQIENLEREYTNNSIVEVTTAHEWRSDTLRHLLAQRDELKADVARVDAAVAYYTDRVTAMRQIASRHAEDVAAEAAKE